MSKKSKSVESAARSSKVVEVPESTEKASRYFHVSDKKIDGGAYFGRFKGKSPKQAATKAFSSIYETRKEKKISVSEKIYFELQEVTRGSKRKTHFYVGERVKLDVPIQVTRGGKVFNFEFSNKIYVDKSAKQ